MTHSEVGDRFSAVVDAKPDEALQRQHRQLNAEVDRLELIRLGVTLAGSHSAGRLKQRPEP
jgi:hypothetical protein